LVGGDAVEGVVATPEKKRKQSNALVVSDDFYNDEEEDESVSRRKRLATGPFVPHLQQQQQRPLVTIEFDGEIFDSVEACLQYASDQLTSLRDTVNYLSDSGAGHMYH
jgi:hypothetical protein